jgi:glyoxylase-like metal-dependent hydrolase (beta-lactamase superfamily II)
VKKYPSFDLLQVSEHAYAAIKNIPQPMSNAGFVDLGDTTIVFDTFLSIAAAEELKQAATAITGHDHFVLVTSHGHSDHFIGNCVFPAGTQIISSPEVREKILNERTNIKLGPQYYSDQIAEMEARLAVSTDVDEKNDIENDLIFYRNFCDPRGSIIPPNMVFTDTLSLYGISGRFDLKRLEIGHSPGDVVGFLSDEHVAFAGDLLFSDGHPWIGSGDPYSLREVLHSLAESDIQTFIPGHGPICGKEKVQEQIDYLDAIIALVRDHLDAPEKLQAADLPPIFHSYQGPCFRWNVDFLAKWLPENTAHR